MKLAQPNRTVHISEPTGPLSDTVVPVEVSVPNPIPLRADARRNLDRILEAAREAFAERGLDVGMEEIARRAGVGKATCFRRFPTKDALVLAVMEGFVEEAEALADQAAAAEDPWDGLRDYMIGHARFQSANAGFFDAIAARFHEGQQFPEEIVVRMTASAERALEPARRAGLLREGVLAGDVQALLKMIGPALRPLPNVRLDEEVWTRYLDVLLSGIRAGQEPMRGRAVDFCELTREAGRLSA